MADAEKAVRSYLKALKDPASLKDEEAIAEAEQALADEEDPITRLKLQQRLAELEAPSMDAVEDEFVVHAKAWADEVGITGKAFAAEGVAAATLRRAGFDVKGGRRSSSRSSSGGGRKRTRVTTEEVIDQIPKGSFTVKMLQESSGASAAVVRKAISTEVDNGNVVEVGPDPDHSGPGRAPTLYRKG